MSQLQSQPQSQSQSQPQTVALAKEVVPAPADPSLTCDQCKVIVAKTLGGLKIYRGKGICLKTQKKDGGALKEKCPHCLLEFSKAGLTTHARSVHPTVFRKKIRSNFEAPLVETAVHGTDKAGRLQQAMLHWQAIFLGIRNTDRD
ncbi:hypothetical protein BV898_10804 [Hypsibius exemplaris]|uniref:Uncharacterized protein n=1 Tax=Hypsibius exemplaris TaxID=2072580 RepID=A0A1W0WIK4_HYPEX|nr:hypothetical protein BV898_10804 [Hypsibius exemplaris]